MPAKPKRPLSAYIIWLNHSREQIKRENPALKITEIARIGGQIWNNLEDKSKWMHKAAQARAKYQRALKVYKVNAANAKKNRAKLTKSLLSGNTIIKKTKKSTSVLSIKRTFC